MKLALLSDSHNNAANLEKAISEANSLHCEVLIHAGDLIEPFFVETLKNFKGRVVLVFGNNDSSTEEIADRARESNVEVAGEFFDGEIGDLKVYVTHYPKVAENIFMAGLHDLVVFGHTHRKEHSEKGGRHLINPGEVDGRRTGLATWALFNTAAKTLEFNEL